MVDDITKLASQPAAGLLLTAVVLGILALIQLMNLNQKNVDKGDKQTDETIRLQGERIARLEGQLDAATKRSEIYFERMVRAEVRLEAAELKNSNLETELKRVEHEAALRLLERNEAQQRVEQVEEKNRLLDTKVKRLERRLLQFTRLLEEKGIEIPAEESEGV